MCDAIDEIQKAQLYMARAREQKKADSFNEERSLEEIAQ